MRTILPFTLNHKKHQFNYPKINYLGIRCLGIQRLRIHYLGIGFRPRGFTIIELMIVIVIIATLSAIAIPSFRNYTARAKVTEALSAVSVAKLDISEQYLNNKMPDEGYELPSVTTKNVQGLSYTRQDDNHAFVSVATQNLGAGLEDGLRFNLYARGSENGIEWDCALSSDPTNALSADYLPSQCKDDAPNIGNPEEYFD